MRRAVVAVVLALMGAGCGGGGGGLPLLVPPPVVTPPPVVNGSISASFDPALVSAESVDGQRDAARANFRARLAYTGNRDIFLGITEDAALRTATNFTINSTTDIDGSVTFDTQRAVGTHDGGLQLLACFDQLCREAVPGSPIRIPLRLVVKPNIVVDAAVNLSRTGREAAPSQDVPVAVPPEAGSLQLNASPSVVRAQWTGSAIRVTTDQSPAGTYTTDLTLSSATDPRYRASVRVTYTVNAPPGGQLPLALQPSGGGPVLEQGQVFSQRIRVQRPTWTDAFQAPVLDDPSGRARLRALGGDDYELSFDASGLAVGSFYRPSIRVSAEPLGGAVEGSWFVQVAGAFSVGSLSVGLTGQSTAAALRLSAPVTVASGAAQRWTARSLTPWVQLLRATGTTGLDTLDVQVGADAVVAQPGVSEGSIEVSIDRPGTLPVTVPVVVGNDIPSIGPAFAAALVGSSTSVYLDGLLSIYNGVTSTLQVSGATLQRATVLADTRFVGSVVVLRVDLQGTSTAAPVVLRSAWPLKTTEVRLPVLAPPRVAGGYAVLPYKAWRSPRWALRHDALFFAADDTLARWSLVGGNWSLQTANLAGLRDAALYGDEQVLLGAGGGQLWRIDASTLAATGSAPLNSGFVSGQEVESRPPPGMSALVVAADGASVAALRTGANGAGDVKVGTIGGQMAALTGSRANGNDPGSVATDPEPAAGAPGAGLVRSPAGETVVGVYPQGSLRWYQASARRPEFRQTVPAGITLSAVSDDGQRLLRSDGVLMVRGTALAGSLAALVPADRQLGGLGLTGSGRFALLYVYRLANEAAGTRARDAQLWVVDLAAVESGGAAAAVVSDRLPLPDAVGCTAPLQTGETCEHRATLAVAPGDASAFVLGPRGVAALPLPAGVGAAASASVVRRPAAAQPDKTLKRLQPAAERR